MLGRHIPFDRHLIECRLGLVPTLGDDGDAAAENAVPDQRRIGNRELHRRDDAGLIANPLEIKTLHRTAIDRTGPDGRPFHAGQSDVDAINRLAGDLQRNIEILLLGAHQRPFRRRLDADPLGMRMRRLRRQRRDLTVGGGPPGRAMGDDAVRRTHLFDRHAPRPCRQPAAGARAPPRRQAEGNSGRPSPTKRRLSACVGKGCSGCPRCRSGCACRTQVRRRPSGPWRLCP